MCVFLRGGMLRLLSEMSSFLTLIPTSSAEEAQEGSSAFFWFQILGLELRILGSLVLHIVTSLTGGMVLVGCAVSRIGGGGRGRGPHGSSLSSLVLSPALSISFGLLFCLLHIMLSLLICLLSRVFGILMGGPIIFIIGMISVEESGDPAPSSLFGPVPLLLQLMSRYFLVGSASSTAGASGLPLLSLSSLELVSRQCSGGTILLDIASVLLL